MGATRRDDDLWFPLSFRINIQSESDLITNSSSEIFCAISEDSIKMVQEYLNSFLPDGVKYSSPSDIFTMDESRYVITFQISYSEDHEKTGRQMYTLIKQLLKEHFPGDNSFTVEDGEIYTVCTEYTLDRLKDIVNSILKIADSTLTADDLFTFELDKESDEYSVYYDRGYKVIPKKENYTEAAKYLSNIMDIFEQAASFDSK